MFSRIKTFYCLSGLALLAPSAAGETIRLKNGRSILVDSVRETEKRVEYTVGESTFAIPKSSVERIDTGGVPALRNAPEAQLPVASAGPVLQLGADDLRAQIIREGRVDSDAVAQIERSGDVNAAAAANFFAAQHERTRGSLDSAARFYDRARTYLPGNDILIGHHASLLLQMNRFSQAASLAEEAVRIAPHTSYHHTVLGFALYNQGKMKEAVRALKRSLELQPDGKVSTLLAKIEREERAESAFDEQASSHFKLRYEGGNAAPVLRRQILDILEAHFNDLVRELDFAPREPVHVLLYTNQEFFNVTRAPAWTGAINDGKIRLPINGIDVVNTELSRILRHELVHSFVNQITRGRAPTWIHEGIAQALDGSSSARDGRRLAALYAAGRAIPLNQLESSFTKFSPAEATVAYAQALASIEYIRDVYGMSSITGVLKRMGEGQSTEAALRASIHSGYAQFERELADWLQRTYPA